MSLSPLVTSDEARRIYQERRRKARHASVAPTAEGAEGAKGAELLEEICDFLRYNSSFHTLKERTSSQMEAITDALREDPGAADMTASERLEKARERLSPIQHDENVIRELYEKLSAQLDKDPFRYDKFYENVTGRGDSDTKWASVLEYFAEDPNPQWLLNIDNTIRVRVAGESIVRYLGRLRRDVTSVRGTRGGKPGRSSTSEGGVFDLELLLPVFRF